MHPDTPEHIREAYDKAAGMLFASDEIPLGPWSSYSLVHDPRHMCFVLSRYKFCAKMLQRRERVMEIGAGDGLGLPIMAQAVKQLIAVDWDQRSLDGNARRLAHLKNVGYLLADFNHAAPDVKVDAVYTVDVLEHVDPAGEGRFIENILRCLPPTGVLLSGTPNITANDYASPPSRAGHVNLKSHDSLRLLMEKYFENVFMFGMNDEVVHTGFGPMCHYLWSLAVGVRPEYRRS